MVRPISGGPEWVEVYNDNAFATSLYGWSFNASSVLQTKYCSRKASSAVILSPCLQVLLHRSNKAMPQMFDLGQYGLLGTGSMNLLDDGAGTIELRFSSR